MWVGKIKRQCNRQEIFKEFTENKDSFCTVINNFDVLTNGGFYDWR